MVTLYQAQAVPIPVCSGGGNLGSPVPTILYPNGVPAPAPSVLPTMCIVGPAPPLTRQTSGLSTVGVKALHPTRVPAPSPPPTRVARQTIASPVASPIVAKVGVPSPSLSQSPLQCRASPQATSRQTLYSQSPRPVAGDTRDCRSPSLLATSKAASVHIDGRTFQRIRELGRGSFGVVWEVQERRSSDLDLGLSTAGPTTLLALKWSTPGRREMLEACLLEAEVLRQLAKILREGSAASKRVPRHVAHGLVSGHIVGPMGPAKAGHSHVLLAMSKLDGQPLDQWLYGVDEQVLKSMPVEQLLNGPLKGGQLATQDLARASATASALLSQMAPVFAALSGIAVHRDLSAHNFLIRCPEGGSEQFSVLDFGLAVRAQVWQQEWCSRNIAGDPRYFAPAAWMLLAFGHKYIEMHPERDFLRQYRDRIDHFAVGVLALEVFFALWRCPGVEVRLGEEEAHTARGELDQSESGVAMRQAREAWHQYWSDTMRLFQRFHREGAVAIRKALTTSEALTHMVDKLRTLCTALRTAADLHPAGSEAAAVLRISAGLIDYRSSSPAWEELPSLLGGDAVTGPGESRSARFELTQSYGTIHSLHCRDSARGRMSVVGRETSTRAAGDALGISVKTTSSTSGREESTERGMLTPRNLAHSMMATIEEAVPVDPVATSPHPTSGKETVSTLHSSPQKLPSKIGKAKFSHRRAWTVDEAVSLSRGVPQMELASSPPATERELAVSPGAQMN